MPIVNKQSENLITQYIYALKKVYIKGVYPKLSVYKL